MKLLCVKLNEKIARLIEAEAKRRGMNLSTYMKYALYYFTLVSIAERYSSAHAASTSSIYVYNPNDCDEDYNNE